MGEELEVNAPSSPERKQLYSEHFENLFPYYLSIGMSYDQYWREDACLVKYYRESEKLKTERKNTWIWLQGMYIYEAICNVAPILQAFAKKGTKARPYPDKPYKLQASATEKEEAEEEEEAAKKKMQRIRRRLEIRMVDMDEQIKRREAITK